MLTACLVKGSDCATSRLGDARQLIRAGLGAEHFESVAGPWNPSRRHAARPASHTAMGDRECRGGDRSPTLGQLVAYTQLGEQTTG